MVSSAHALSVTHDIFCFHFDPRLVLVLVFMPTFFVSHEPPPDQIVTLTKLSTLLLEFSRDESQASGEELEMYRSEFDPSPSIGTCMNDVFVNVTISSGGEGS